MPFKNEEVKFSTSSMIFQLHDYCCDFRYARSYHLVSSCDLSQELVKYTERGQILPGCQTEWSSLLSLIWKQLGYHV